MSSPLTRLTDSVVEPDASPAVVHLDGGDADVVFDALGSETARDLFCALSEDPAPPSRLADRVDTSVQNVHYHLSNLQASGIVEAVDTTYSEKGNEMTVYGPVTDPIVLTGTADPAVHDSLSRSVRDWATGVAALALASLAVQVGVDRLTPSTEPALLEPASVGVSDPGGPLWLALTVVEPGVLFFVGGLLVFVAAALRERGWSPLG